jgi:hypothetical protein
MNSLTVFASILVLCASTATAQETKTAVSAASNAPKHFYRLNFVLKESDEGKVINQRSFVMSASTEGSSWRNMRAGTRLPLARTNSKDVNYIDVGVNIDTRIQDSGDGLAMDVTTDISSAGTENNSGAPPVIRQVKVRSEALVPIGKPTTLFTADDPASRHRFELEVTATPER